MSLLLEGFETHNVLIFFFFFYERFSSWLVHWVSFFSMKDSHPGWFIGFLFFSMKDSHPGWFIGDIDCFNTTLKESNVISLDGTSG